MINTIAFSTDLFKVYLIDQDQLHAYKLAGTNGITIGLIDGQLAVVTPIGPSTGSVFTTGEDSIASGDKKKGILRIELNDNSQYSLGYNKETQAVSLIGALDIISTINDPTPPTGTCDLHLFDLSGGRTLNLRHNRDVLVVTFDTAAGTLNV